jgi:hypothetical protein
MLISALYEVLMSGSRALWVRSVFCAFLAVVLLSLSQNLAEGAEDSVIFRGGSNRKITTQANGLPKGWKLRIWQGEPDIKVMKEKGKNIIRLRSKVASVSIYKDIKLDLQKYPLLKWRWKVTKLPKDADARVNNKDDQAAGIYVVFPRFPSMINSQLLAYVWETSVPVGTVMRNRRNPMVHYIVVRSGKNRLNEWITEERNVMEDYKKVFGKAPPMVGGISLLIDTDDTHSQAESYFSKIEFLKRAHVRITPPANRLVKSFIPNTGIFE